MRGRQACSHLVGKQRRGETDQARHRPDPEALEGAFAQRIPLAVASWAPSFFHGKVIAEIADRDADLDKVCANLLTAERATGSKLEKVILYRGSPAPDTTNMENLFGIHLFSVSDPREAAELVVARL